ncbi:nucleolar complex-associated protein, partial [Trifolium medium]|nr:nucleolar complex-associated protein [Trifolium medium]
MMFKKQQQILLPPDLPPEILDDDVEFPDDDVKLVNENHAYASLLSNFDTQSIT